MSASSKKKSKAKKAPAKGKVKPKVAPAKKAAKPVVAKEDRPKKVAAKERKPEEKREVQAKPVAKEARMELGPPPVAMVAVRHIDSMHERRARGFSFGELASAGVPLEAARREGLLLDLRRRSVVGGNVEMLKGWLKSPKAEWKQGAGAAAAKK